MVVVVIVSSLASLAVMSYIKVLQNSKDTKLEQDVATVNRAIVTYRGNGGSLMGLSAPQQVLDRLKAKLSAADAVQMPGLRKGMVDNRLAVLFQTSSEANSDDQRAFWNPVTEAFYISNAGADGIREFTLDDSLSTIDYGTDVRNSAFKLAKEQRWIWDFENAYSADRSGPEGRPRSSTASGVNDSPSRAGALTLNPPDFSLLTGDYPLTYFPQRLTLTSTNPPGASEIIYSVNSGPWLR